jgi:hypothetical protein
MIKNIIGFSGAFVFLSAYFLNATLILNAKDISFHLLNLIGASLLGYRVYLDRNISNLLLEIAFGIIAIYHIVKILI